MTLMMPKKSMARFIAIPVGQGDAFYLQRDDFSILVDGGRSRSGFPQMFQATTHADRVNVLICTHNDADHVNGILGFLESGLGCDEVWLPGRWLEILPDILRPFVEVFGKLAANVEKDRRQQIIDLHNPDLSPIEIHGERADLPLSEADESGEKRSIGDDGWPEKLIDTLEQSDPWDISSGGRWCSHPEWPFVHYRHWRELGPEGVRLLWSAIDAASRIRSIALEAFHRGVPIRWFEYNPTNPSGGVPDLVPINARQIARVRSRVGTLLFGLSLTTSNKESLVFWSPPTDRHPGVLFNADSDLANMRLPSPLRAALATAPHHGSEANANAYAAVAAAATSTEECNSITWVRSDGRYKSRPGFTYLKLSARRLCTLCRPLSGSSATKQAVRLFSRGGSWIKHRATNTCVCQ